MPSVTGDPARFAVTCLRPGESGAPGKGCPGLTVRSTGGILPFHRKGNGDEPALDLLNGTVDVLVHQALAWGPAHGYAVASWIRQRTDGVLALEDAPLYKALHRLERQGCVVAEWGLSENNRRAKYYQLTAQGRQQLGAKTSYWTAYAAAVFRILRTA